MLFLAFVVYIKNHERTPVEIYPSENSWMGWDANRWGAGSDYEHFKLQSFAHVLILHRTYFTIIFPETNILCADTLQLIFGRYMCTVISFSVENRLHLLKLINVIKRIVKMYKKILIQ